MSRSSVTQPFQLLSRFLDSLIGEIFEMLTICRGGFFANSIGIDFLRKFLVCVDEWLRSPLSFRKLLLGFFEFVNGGGRNSSIQLFEIDLPQPHLLSGEIHVHEELLPGFAPAAVNAFVPRCRLDCLRAVHRELLRHRCIGDFLIADSEPAILGFISCSADLPMPASRRAIMKNCSA
jgi:hypothetical protein